MPASARSRRSPWLLAGTTTWRNSRSAPASPSSRLSSGKLPAATALDIINLLCTESVINRINCDVFHQIIGCSGDIPFCHGPAGLCIRPLGLLHDRERPDCDLEPEQDLCGSQGRIELRRLRQGRYTV